MKIGTKVMMTEEYKSLLRKNQSGAHVEEFGHMVGTIVPKNSDVEDWPEVSVEWGDTGLRYLYAIHHLTEVN